MPAIHIEVSTGHIGDLPRHSLLQQAQGVHALRQGHPDEQPALGARVPCPLREGGQLTEHGLHLLPVARRDGADVGRQQVLPQVLIHDRLVQVGGVHVRGLLADGALAQDVRVPRHVADPEARGDHLAEGPEEDHPAILVVMLDGQRAFAGVPQIPVGIVLRDHEAVLRGDLRNGSAAVGREGDAGGILEGGDDVEHLRVIGPGGFLQLLRDNAVLIRLHGHQLRLVQAHALDIAQEGGILDQDHIPGVDQRLAEQIHRLGGAGDGQHLGHFPPDDAFRVMLQALHKGRIALRRAILEDRLAVVPQDLRGDLRHLPVRQGAQRGVAAREGDHAGFGDHLEDLADGAAGDAVKAAGKPEPAVFHVHASLSGYLADAKTPSRTGKVTIATVPLPFSRRAALSGRRSSPSRCNRRTGCRLLTRGVQRMARGCTSPRTGCPLSPAGDSLKAEGAVTLPLIALMEAL